jgi:hypothetical protein
MAFLSLNFLQFLEAGSRDQGLFALMFPEESGIYV